MNMLALRRYAPEMVLPTDGTIAIDRPYWIDVEEETTPTTHDDAPTSVIDHFRTSIPTVSEAPLPAGNPIIFFNPEKVSGKPFLSLQKWEGVVLESIGDYFVAKLSDLNVPGLNEVAEIPIEEIAYADRAKIVPGSMFYWNIGYRDPHGRRERTSVIIFKRLLSFSRNHKAAAKNKAEAIADKLGWG